MDVNSFPRGTPPKTRQDFVELLRLSEALKSIDPDSIQKDINILFNSKDLSTQQKAARRLNLVGDNGWKYLCEKILTWVNDDDPQSIILRDIFFILNVDNLNEAQTNIDLLVNKKNSVSVRSSAATYFCDNQSLLALDILIETVLFDNTPEVRAAAVMALSWYSGERVKQTLLQSLKDDDRTVRETAKDYMHMWD